MKHYEVACAIIKNNEGLYLCCKRGKGRALDGFWEFPGGKIEKGETCFTAIKREIKEELKATITPIKLLATVDYTYHNMDPYEDFSITLHGVLCSLEDKITLTEHTEYKFCSRSQLDSINFAQADKLILPYIK